MVHSVTILENMKHFPPRDLFPAMLPLILFPSVAAEVNKWVLRKMSEKEQLARAA